MTLFSPLPGVSSGLLHVHNDKILLALLPLNTCLCPVLREIWQRERPTQACREFAQAQRSHGNRDVGKLHPIGQCPHGMDSIVQEIPVEQQAEPVVGIAAYLLGIAPARAIGGLKGRAAVKLNLDERCVTHKA